MRSGADAAGRYRLSDGWPLIVVDRPEFLIRAVLLIDRNRLDDDEATVEVLRRFESEEQAGDRPGRSDRCPRRYLESIPAILTVPGDRVVHVVRRCWRGSWPA